MLYVAITPSFVWAALLIATWSVLTYDALRGLGIRHPVMKGLLAVLALQVVAGVSVAIATRIDPIGPLACLVGIFGAMGSLAVTAIQAAAIGFLATIWPRETEGTRRRFKRWTATWLFFSLVALLTHLRSAALCTV